MAPPGMKEITAPPGTEEVRFPRLTSPVGQGLQLVSALIFASYFFFAPIGALVLALLSPKGAGLLSWRSIAAGLSAYVAQLALYRPHVSKGWKRFSEWFLYSPFTDCVLHYYDSTCIREGPAPDPKGQYMFAVYPHGIYGVCRAFSGGTANWRKLYPGIFGRWGSFGAAFYLPGIREFSLMCGCLDASKPVLQRAIKRGENIILLPGGLDEMAMTDGTSPDTKLVMQDRKGYAKLAIENGMDVIPGFCFGEKWLHRTVQLPGAIQKFLRLFRISGTFPRGRGPTFLGYLGVPMGFVWCEPVKVKQQKPVDPEYLDEVHAAVEASLRSAFARYKERFGYGPDETLSIVSAKDAYKKA